MRKLDPPYLPSYSNARFIILSLRTRRIHIQLQMFSSEIFAVKVFKIGIHLFVMSLVFVLQIINWYFATLTRNMIKTHGKLWGKSQYLLIPRSWIPLVPSHRIFLNIHNFWRGNRHWWNFDTILELVMFSAYEYYKI